MRRRRAKITGAQIIERASRMLGVVISGNKALPYLITAAPKTDPPASFSTYLRSSPCLKLNFYASAFVVQNFNVETFLIQKTRTWELTGAGSEGVTLLLKLESFFREARIIRDLLDDVVGNG